jgi:hypothetical protein
MVLTRFAVLVLTALCASHAPALAQQPPDPAQMLQRMDRDGDGRIAPAEWRGPPPAFAKLDADGDGYLSSAELQARAGRGAGGQARTAAQAGARRAPLAWVDCHLHLRKANGSFDDALAHTVALMDQAGVRAAVLMPPPFPASGQARNRHDVVELSRLTEAFPGRFLFLGGGDLLNGLIEGTPPEQVSDGLRADFTRKAEQILAAGARGFGEMGMTHFGHFAGHPSYEVAPDHPLFLLLADIAGRHRAVIEIHMDVVEREAPTPETLRGGGNPASMTANVAAFERLVAHNRNARVVLAHAGWDVTGQWSAALSRRLLAAHSNLSMSLKLVNRDGSRENRLMTADGTRVAPDWLAVLQAFPGRFVIGSDSFVAGDGATARGPGGATRFHGDRIAALLRALPRGLAERIAAENALALYGEP